MLNREHIRAMLSHGPVWEASLSNEEMVLEVMPCGCLVLDEADYSEGRNQRFTVWQAWFCEGDTSEHAEIDDWNKSITVVESSTYEER